MIVFDEAHEYVSSDEMVDELEYAITQMRHDGVSFVLATQEPKKIPGRVFRFLLTRLIFKLTAQESLAYLKSQSVNLKGLDNGIVGNLDLEQGVCFVQSDDSVSDECLKSPQRLLVRPRCTQHGGATVLAHR
jgi:hypothetical protein